MIEWEKLRHNLSFIFEIKNDDDILNLRWMIEILINSIC